MDDRRLVVGTPAMLGHELRNPLASIPTALELMRLRGGNAMERERTVIERRTRHLASLVDDLLDVSRIARGMVQLKRSPVSLGVLRLLPDAARLPQALAELQRRLETRRVRCRS